ncbi:hypothetical protein BDN71DRAFT_1092864 [Pleurotus eryngii]|uniref:Uncharacterized protein n=1 Tax=Pleurotus eryngii TaxID=5323 RepID=A0A9P6D701_PLEER|nr:hypothetical protein BDN71DRAFT_1092864 [Pleurotus eryngii]
MLMLMLMLIVRNCDAMTSSDDQRNYADVYECRNEGTAKKSRVVQETIHMGLQDAGMGNTR